MVQGRRPGIAATGVTLGCLTLAATLGPAGPVCAETSAATGPTISSAASSAASPAATGPRRPVGGRAAYGAGGPWVAPMAGGVAVLRRFDPPAERWLAGHRGVDLAVAAGAPVRAAGAGTVGFAGTVGGRGVVTVVHGLLRTTYEPVTAQVHRGDRVAAGTQLGVLAAGAGHCAPLSCLHWGLLRGGTYLDPLLLLSAPRPVRLLPLG